MSVLEFKISVEVTGHQIQFRQGWKSKHTEIALLSKVLRRHSVRISPPIADFTIACHSPLAGL
jgi:hypothetical protein